ncbi:MAG: Fe-S protein assembly co-chaperone HscB [Candidatus Dasytiphilus stammeri]
MLTNNLTKINSNYFDLFRLPLQFNIDQKLLAIRFYELQQQFHPDQCINKSVKDKKWFVEQCALINQAWQILREPLSRAVYILSLYGFDIDNEAYSLNKDVSFLTEQLELREECEQIEQQLNEIILNNFITKIDKLISKFIVQIEHQMNFKKWEQAIKTVQKLQFLTKLRHHLDNLENRLFDF